jgi:small subunit ribosomal protein S4
VANASKAREASGDHLLRSLELRLDNLVRRMGVATSIKTARQVVMHGHVKVNGRGVNIPSFPVKAGDQIVLSPKLKENVGVKLSLETAKKLNQRPTWIEFNEAALSAKVLRIPERAEMSFPINDQLIIEYYSR